MSRLKINFLSITSWLAIIGADIFIYLILGLAQMDYDDNWSAAKGEYGSLKSMNTSQLAFYFALQLWNILNVIGIIFVGRKIYKRIKYGT